MAIKLSSKEIGYFKDGDLKQYRSKDDINTFYKDDSLMVIGDD